MATAENLGLKIGEEIRYCHPLHDYKGVIVGYASDGGLLIESPDFIRENVAQIIFNPGTGEIKGVRDGQNIQRLLDSQQGEIFAQYIPPNDHGLRAISLQQFMRAPFRCLFDSLTDWAENLRYRA